MPILSTTRQCPILSTGSCSESPVFARHVMLNLAIARPAELPFRLLCLGSHSDDLEIGCGGTVLKIIREYKKVTVHWVVFSGSEERAAEARASASTFLEGAEHQIEIKAFRDGFF